MSLSGSPVDGQTGGDGGVAVTLCHQRSGMVLVDSVHEDQAAALQQQLSPRAWSKVSNLFGSENPERMDFGASAEQARSSRELGELPLVVLQAGRQHTNSEDSGHFMQKDRPEAVVEAVRSVLADVGQ